MEARLKELFPNGLTGLIYDCDGVMIDSADGNRHLYNLILAHLGLPPITEEQERFAFQSTFERAIKMLAPGRPHGEIDAAVKQAIDYDRDVLPRIKLMPGYRAFVDKARAMGLRQAVDTNRTDFGINRIIDHFDLPHWFDPVISSSASEPKPSPAGVERISAAWGCAPASMLFVGDNPDDRAAAKGGGAMFAAFGPSDLTGDIKIASWAELGEMLWGRESIR